MPSVTLGKAFAECKIAFAECLRHSAKNAIPVVIIFDGKPTSNSHGAGGSELLMTLLKIINTKLIYTLIVWVAINQWRSYDLMMDGLA